MKYDRKMMNDMADNLENYLYIIDSFIIIEGISKEEYKEAVKTVKKLIKKLRNGEGESVFDEEKYIKYMKKRNGV